MNKNTHLFSIAMTILLSSTMGFASENNNERYNQIVAALSSAHFVFQGNGDIKVVEEHKATLQKELDSYKNSWTPTLLKMLSAGFALESIAGGMRTIAYADTTDSVRKILIPIVLKMTYLTYPISLATTTIKQQALRTLYNTIENSSLSHSTQLTTFRVGTLLVFSGAMVATGLAAKYLFDKANSYKTEITRLEEEIKTDDALIVALQNQ